MRFAQRQLSMSGEEAQAAVEEQPLIEEKPEEDELVVEGAGTADLQELVAQVTPAVDGKSKKGRN
jgi:hypothetical protein